MGMASRFRKGRCSASSIAGLLGHLSDHRPSTGRRRGGRLFDLLKLLLGLSELPDRPVRDRDHQHGRRNDRTQNARYFFRIHLDIPGRL
jgi:hypothetical protein